MQSPPSRLLRIPRLLHLLSQLVLIMHGIAATDVSSSAERHYLHNERSNRGLAYSSWSPRGCLYEGQWHMSGHEVVARTACLRCACADGVLTCSRRACQPLPDPPPPRCHLLHKKGRCCPELHCPNEVIVSEQVASSRLEDSAAVTTSATFNHACVEGGTVYAAGSAMESPVACEQCFCLRGVRQCVRPRCLPPPPGCSGRPVAGLCCPQRYYCHHDTTTPPGKHHANDCVVDGATIPEGDRVPQWETSRNCSQCFCLHGAVRCQELACAPPLLGCQPLLRAGECCAHQYLCHHDTASNTPDDMHNNRVSVTMLTRNDLSPTENQDRSFHSKNTDKIATTASSTVTDEADKETPATSTSPTEVILSKIKRKTVDNVPITRGQIIEDNIPSTNPPTTQTVTDRSVTDTTEGEHSEDTTTAAAVIESDRTSTDLQEGTVRVMINGTINCSTEFSSTSEPMNVTVNDTEQIIKESIPRVPYITRMNEEHTFNPNDIITDRNVNGGFDENETFTINVTSSLRTNTSQSQLGSSVDAVAKPGVVTDLKPALNTSKQTKEEYDYDYIEPTLPPSLPNLKIIPFVAADAVVDNDEITPKVAYPILEREDKFPVYYPKEKVETPFASRREDVYNPTDYPTFTSLKTNQDHKPPQSHGLIDTKNADLESSIQSYLYSVSLSAPELSKYVTKSPSVTFAVEKPSENLFSPPVETEGGFVPKNPSINDEYLSVYMSTPSPAPLVPHLTTSMQLDTDSESCTSSDGRRVAAGDYVTVSCSECVCVWGEMHCSPRSGVGPCCGDVFCERINTTNTVTTILPLKKNATENDDTDSLDNNTPAEDQTETLQTETGPDNENIGENLEAANEEPKIDITTSTTDAPNIMNVTEPALTTSFITPSSESTRKETRPPSTTPNPLDYEEDDEEEGFLGNVLKLLLSESFEVNKTPPPNKKSTIPEITTEFVPTTNSNPTNNYKLYYTKPKLPATIPNRVPSSPSTANDASTRLPPLYSTPQVASTTLPLTNSPQVPTRSPPQIPPVVPFLPLPRRPVRLPERFTDNSLSHLYPLNIHQRPPTSVNRIDHLVLGEATAIHRTTVKPVSIYKPASTTLRPTTQSMPETTRKPFVTSRLPEDTTRTKFESATSLKNEVRHSVNSAAGNMPLGVGGLLKLAGCNIYGKMYKVGGRIAELSTPCQECKCTELGIQCKPLSC